MQRGIADVSLRADKSGIPRPENKKRGTEGSLYHGATCAGSYSVPMFVLLGNFQRKLRLTKILYRDVATLRYQICAKRHEKSAKMQFLY